MRVAREATCAAFLAVLEKRFFGLSQVEEVCVTAFSIMINSASLLAAMLPDWLRTVALC